jgi:hypothetical protein
VTNATLQNLKVLGMSVVVVALAAAMVEAEIGEALKALSSCLSVVSPKRIALRSFVQRLADLATSVMLFVLATGKQAHSEVLHSSHLLTRRKPMQR